MIENTEKQHMCQNVEKQFRYQGDIQNIEDLHRHLSDIHCFLSQETKRRRNEMVTSLFYGNLAAMDIVDILMKQEHIRKAFKAKQQQARKISS